MTDARYRIRFHPKVQDDLVQITVLIAEYSGSLTAARILGEIERSVATLSATPHKGSLRDDIAPGIRAVPAGRRAVVAFTVDDAAREVRVIAITYGGADWLGRIRPRT
ncbi:type II toxin-antitoxin system RelE/ParE family toxin [Ruegeria pomeroyi]|nr:type II toxin-antitoxin system RelE/ParE family toxin [Ruegeria pomeroyi]MCE8534751.1 type II toxin-antitoxin system RelE/ParE family toxin [Ruegeria pomeroyi]